LRPRDNCAGGRKPLDGQGRRRKPAALSLRRTDCDDGGQQYAQAMKKPAAVRV
jgi:hypothetical protein